MGSSLQYGSKNRGEMKIEISKALKEFKTYVNVKNVARRLIALTECLFRS